MTNEELFQKIVLRLPFTAIHPLYRAMFEECCENAVENSIDEEDEETQILSVLVAFITCNSLLKALISSSCKNSTNGLVTFYYRDQTFIIPKNSILLK